MRSLAMSRARLSARVAVLAIIAASAAGCSADMARFSDKPFSSAAAPKPAAGDVAMAAPSGRVESQSLPAPRQANISSTGVPMRSSAATSASRIAGANAAVHPTAAQPGGIHVVAPGETLTSIARLYGKARTDIARANSIDAGAAVHVGQRLTIPGVKQAQIKTTPATTQAAATPAPAAATKPAEKPTQVASAQPVASARLATPATESPEPKQASATAELTGAVPSFRWPVRGRVIAGYGAKVNGASNDGINMSVPEGTSVKAAEDGVVAYAGNELKGYGNLVLVRHSNGFVTAYAHASEIKVKRGDAVKRGQIVALAGQTGNVTSPQLHFEIRKGSTPIDPTQYLSN
jgi:murein DD-endopeptidase MepM/ murein hydrolase activator NlpD